MNWWHVFVPTAFLMVTTPFTIATIHVFVYRRDAHLPYWNAARSAAWLSLFASPLWLIVFGITEYLGG